MNKKTSMTIKYQLTTTISQNAETYPTIQKKKKNPRDRSKERKQKRVKKKGKRKRKEAKKKEKKIEA